MYVALLSTLLCIILLNASIVYRQKRRKGHGQLPPGPKMLPLLGNIRDMPPNGAPEFEHWIKHKELYGNISAMNVLGMTFIIIHDKKAAHELLEQTGASSRPTMVMANTLCGYENIVLCQGYGPTLRRCRKYLHRELGTQTSAERFFNIQRIEVRRQLLRALHEPERWLEHFKTTAAATVLKVAYGYTIEPHKPDALIGISEKMMTEFSLASRPMAWAVDIVPALRYLPEICPGAGFKKTAREWRKTIQATAYVPYAFVRQQMAADAHESSYVSKLVQDLTEDSDGILSRENEEAVIWTAASLYGAAADTTALTLTIFTLAMVQFPGVQRKAQDEIDFVIGTKRLPDFADRGKLPYVNALVKEVLRWWPIAPMGFPHTTTKDLAYDNLHIPKHAHILPAVWWFLHDPEVYHDPESFDPARFLPPRSEPDPATEAFGYGVRSCPGRNLADSSLYLNIAQSLAAFDISKAVGNDGEDIRVDVRPKPGILAYPTKFEFQVKPRSERHIDIIKSYEEQSPWEESDARLLKTENDFNVAIFAGTP